MDFFELWPEAVSTGTDATAYLVMALVATTLFVLRLALALFGAEAGGDFELGGAASASDASFGFLSLLSILAFFMGAGWMGLACRVNWGLGSLPSALAASGFGFAMMSLASVLSWATRQLDREIRVDPRSAIGRTGRVYLAVPAKGAGTGQVEVSVSGRRKVVPAVSAGPAIESFRDVVVQDVRDDETYVVAPLE